MRDVILAEVGRLFEDVLMTLGGAGLTRARRGPRAFGGSAAELRMDCSSQTQPPPPLSSLPDPTVPGFCNLSTYKRSHATVIPPVPNEQATKEPRAYRVSSYKRTVSFLIFR